MNWRGAFAFGVLAVGLSLTFVPRVSADPPPWAGVWRHNKHVDWEHRDRAEWRAQRDWRDYGYRREVYGRRYYGGYGYRSYDPRYAKLTDRMAYDQAQIAKITPTGRHRKALQWYKDDLQNARRDLYNYRYRGASYYSEPPPPYDPYYQPSGSYDPYAGDTGRSFDWKHDWPLLVGQVLTQPR